MGRYSLRLRDKYGADELSPGERIERGVSGAIQTVLDETEKRRGERNTLAPNVVAPAPLNPAAAPTPGDVNAHIARNLPSASSVMGASSATPAPVTPRPSIASAMQPALDAFNETTHDYELRDGSRVRLDPMKQDRAKFGMQTRERSRLAAEDDARGDARTARDIALRGDEARRTNAEADARRAERERQRDGRKATIDRELARLRASGRKDTDPEVMQLRRDRLDLDRDRYESAEMRRDEGAVVNTTRAIAGMSKTDPMTAAAEASNPEARAARERTVARTAAPVVGVQKAAQSRLANRKATPEQMSARAEALAREGKSDTAIRAQMRREGYPTRN